MAGVKLNTRLKASTMLEVIISMVVIMVIFSIAMMIYNNVLTSSISAKKIHAQALLEETMQKAEQDKPNTNQTFMIDEFNIEQEATPYNDESALTTIHLTAYDQNQQKVAELQKVIINEP